MEFDYGGRDGIFGRGDRDRLMNPDVLRNGGLDGFGDGRRDGGIFNPDLMQRERFDDGFGGIDRNGDFGGRDGIMNREGGVFGQPDYINQGGFNNPGIVNPGYNGPGPVINIGVNPQQQPGYGGFGNGFNSFTCPMGDGYTPYCPMPGDDPWQINCCTSFFFGEPTCCYFSISVGKIIFIILCTIVIIGILIAFWRAVQPSRRPQRGVASPARRDGENLLYLDNEPRRNERKVSFRS